MTYVWAILGALILMAGSDLVAYHFGRLAVEEGDYKTLSSQYQTELQKRVAAESALQKVQDDYDAIKDVPDPASAGLAERVRLVEAPCLSPVNPAPGGTTGPSAQPPSDTQARAIIDANQAVYDACQADAKQLNSLEAWIRSRP